MAAMAVTWNIDILYHIVAELEQPDMANAARVCRTWLPVLRSQLYRHIIVDSSLKHAHTLGARLLMSEDLRSLVRHLTLSRMFGTEDWLRPMVEWILLLPEKSLDSVDVQMTDGGSFVALFDCPSMRTVSRMKIRQRWILYEDPARAAAVMANPYLQSLAIYTNNLPVPQAELRLHRLSIAAEDMPVALPRVLGAVDRSTPLQRFDLRITSQPTDDAVADLVGALAPHAPFLTRLAIISGERVGQAPLMDDLILSVSSVRWLCCPYGSYTSTLLLRTPAALHTLVLLWGIDGTTLIRDPHGMGFIAGPRPGNVPFPSAEFCSVLSRMASQGRQSLKRLVIALPDVVRDRCEMVAEACRAAGVQFERVRMSDDVLGIMD